MLKLKIVTLLTLALVAASALSCLDDKKCRECGIDGASNPVCTFCDNSYFDQTKSACEDDITDRISNCLSYQKANGRINCAICEPGFVIDIDGKCLPCSSTDCAICNVNGECLACKGGIRLVDNRCDSKTKCKDSNCEICRETNTTAICSSCQQDFMKVLTGECIKATNNCQIAESASGKCLRCETGFYLTEDSKCSNDMSTGHGVVWWLLIIAVVACLGYAAYYFFVLRKQETDFTPVEDYIAVN